MDRFSFTGEIKKSMERLQIPFAVYLTEGGTIVPLILSDGFCSLFGFSDREQAYEEVKRDTFSKVHPDDKARINNTVAAFVAGKGDLDMIFRIENNDGDGHRIIHASGVTAATVDGKSVRHVWFSDEGIYSEEMGDDFKLNAALNNALRESSILNASRYDALTGLANMTYFFDLTTAARDDLIEQGGVPALLFLDLCGLKYFNHKHGFAEGDKLLKSFSEALVKIFDRDNCCRIGQDHFTVFAPARGLEEKLDRLFAECRAINGGDSLPVRVGIYRDRGDETIPASAACDRAKLACDSLKGIYASEYCYYRHELKDDVLNRQYILDSFDRALEERNIVVYYQPIIRSVNDKVCDEEALSRWIDPVKGFMSPADFIPTLEKAGLIYKLDLYVLDRVLEKIKYQESKGLTVVPTSINLSRSDFDACDIVEEIRRRVDAAGVGRDKITIEITESMVGRDFDFMKQQVARFRDLGFPVWMDDFGSGYSSLDVLQSIKFDLVKFDMSFMRKLDEGDRGKIILTELMKLTAALGLDTVCEGVETEEQQRFMREIGCSKLQGYYYGKPIPADDLFSRYEAGVVQFGYENPEESEYYEAMGRVNLYDLAVLVGSDGGKTVRSEDPFQNSYNTLPMGIIEVRGDETRFVRSNKSYRDFIKRYIGLDLSSEGSTFTKYSDSFMNNVVNTCCERGQRAFYDESMPDGSVVHSFARRVGVNPVNGTVAVAVAVLSITGADEGATYASIARALATDYYNIYYVDLETEKFIEYTSPVGGENLAMERHGENFFKECFEAANRIYDEDRAPFFASFTKENIIRELDEQGVFTSTYRLMDTGTPMYVNMKITRMQPNGNHIIMGVSIIDAQMKQKQALEEIQKERDALARVMALSEGYLSLYSIDADTGRYFEYSTTNEYDSLGFNKEGEDFFYQGAEDGKRVVYGSDLPEFLRLFTKENVMSDIRNTGVFNLHYRLVIGGEPKPVTLRIASVKDTDKEKLVAGVRAWKVRA